MKTPGFCPSSASHQAVTSGSPLDRRTLLRGTGQASLAAGLAAAGLSGITPAFDAHAHSALRQDAECTRLLIVAKRAVEIETLKAQGYPVGFVTVRDVHTWTCWRDAWAESLGRVSMLTRP